MRAVAGLLLVVAGCSQTAVAIDVALGPRDAAPTALTVSVFDPHRALLADRAIGTRLPGRITLENLPPLATPLRIAIDGAAGLEAGVAVTVVPNATTHVTATLSAAISDVDHDGVPDSIDDCPTVPNANQANAAGGLRGDACRNGGGDGGLLVDLAAPSGSDLAAPPGSDLAGLDLAGAVVGGCPAGAIVCDGFESGIAAVWTADHDPLITISTDGAHKHTGAAALHFHSAATQSYTQSDLVEEKSQPMDDTWLRVWVYVPSLTEPYSAQLLSFYQNNGAPFGYVFLSLDPGGKLELHDTAPPTTARTASMPFPTDVWTCLEWHFVENPNATDLAGATGSSQVWLGGIDVPELHVTTLTASPPFGAFLLGMTINSALPSGGDIWYDDFSIGATRQGCN